VVERSSFRRGYQLSRYMIDYGVGVSVMDVFELKKIDSDFFEEEL